jgi:hypothetical protein
MGVEALPRTCWICGKAIALETCNVDEHGLAVHEHCYVGRITLEATQAPQTLLARTFSNRRRPSGQSLS